MNFSKTTSYSLNILSYMAQNDKVRMSAAYLHNELHIPYSYLRALLSELSKSGLVTGIKGRNGGFRLNRDKSQIFLTEIIEATEGPDSFNTCIMGFKECPFNYRCLIHPVWVKMKSEMLELLRTTSLDDLFTGEKNCTKPE
jgi:Rrf2 family protein